MKLVITNDFALMLSMMGGGAFLTVDVREGNTNSEGCFVTASIFPSGQIFMAQIDSEVGSTNLKYFTEGILGTAEEDNIPNIILDMSALSSETHRKICDVLSTEFKESNLTLFITENDADRTNSSYIDEYAERIYDKFLEGLNCGATLINLPDVDFFDEKKHLVLDEKFVPRFVPGFLSCFLILGAKDFSSQLYRMVKKEGSKVFFNWEMSFSDYISNSTDLSEGEIDDRID